MGIPTRSETALKMNMLMDHLCSHHDDQLVSLPGFLRFVTAFITARNKVEKAEDGSTKSPQKEQVSDPTTFGLSGYLLFIIAKFRRSWIMIIQFFWTYFWVQRQKKSTQMLSPRQLSTRNPQRSGMWAVQLVGRVSQNLDSLRYTFCTGSCISWFIECLQTRLKIL